MNAIFDILTIIIACGYVYEVRNNAVLKFKISYYEQKLKNRDVDISHVESISSLKEVINHE